jgi:hypothetical protein
LQNLLAVALERRTKLSVHVVVEETVSSVELQQQHIGFAAMAENEFLQRADFPLPAWPARVTH